MFLIWRRKIRGDIVVGSRAGVDFFFFFFSFTSAVLLLTYSSRSVILDPSPITKLLRKRRVGNRRCFAAARLFFSLSASKRADQGGWRIRNDISDIDEAVPPFLLNYSYIFS